MGTYIQAGICYSMKISKNHLKDSNIRFEEVIEGLGKQIPINLYKLHETENNYVWNLNEEVLEKGQLLEFLMEQYKLFNAYHR